MSLSSLPYNWDNVIHVIKKIYSIINFKDPKCDIYTMEYISQSPIHCLKVNIKRALNYTKFPLKKANADMFRTNVHQLNTNTINLVFVLTKKRKNKFTCPIFDNPINILVKTIKNCSWRFYFSNQIVGYM